MAVTFAIEDGEFLAVGDTVSEKVTPQGNRVAFGKDFEIARRSPFKLLRERPPEDWNASRRRKLKRMDAARLSIAARQPGEAGEKGETR